jgi:hypothetical protein
MFMLIESISMIKIQNVIIGLNLNGPPLATPEKPYKPQA